MKQKNLLLKGMLAVLLVFAVTFVACDNSASVYVPFEPDETSTPPIGETPILNVEVEEVKIKAIEPIEMDDVDGIFGYRLVWFPTKEVKTYEVWRESRGGTYKDRLDVKGNAAMEKTGEYAGYFIYEDIVNLDKNNEPTLEEGVEYNYTVIAIPIMSSVRDTTRDFITVTAGEMVEKGSKVPAPAVTLTINPEKWTFTMVATAASAGFYPTGATTWALYDPDGNEMENLTSSPPSGTTYAEPSNVPTWTLSIWRSETQAKLGKYTLKGKTAAASTNGYFATSAVIESEAVRGLIFVKNADTTEPKLEAVKDGAGPYDYSTSTGYVTNTNTGGRVSNYYSTLSLAKVRGSQIKDGVLPNVTYVIQRAKSNDAGDAVSGAWQTVTPMYKYGVFPIEDLAGTGYLALNSEEMNPDQYGNFPILTVFDRTIPYEKKPPKYFYRIIGTNEDTGIVEYLPMALLENTYPGAIELANPNLSAIQLNVMYRAPNALVAPITKVTAIAKFTPLLGTEDDYNQVTTARVRYTVTPDLGNPFKGLMGENDTVEFYWALGGPGKTNVQFTGGYGATKYDYDLEDTSEAAPTPPALLEAGRLVFTRSEIEQTPPKAKSFELDLVTYAKKYGTPVIEAGMVTDAVNWALAAAPPDGNGFSMDNDEIVVTAFLVDGVTGDRISLLLGNAATAPVTWTATGLVSTTVDETGVIKQYKLAAASFQPTTETLASKID